MSTKNTGKKLQTLNLLLLKGNLYPSDSADYDLLKRRGVVIYRIPVSSLEQLKKTALTQLNIEIGPFSNMWSLFVPHLEAELANYGKLHAASEHEFWLKVPEDGAAAADKYFTKVSRFVQRYCIRLAVDIVKAEGVVKYKLKFIYSEDLNNSYAFQSENSEGVSVELLLTEYLKLVVTSRVFEGSPALTIQVKDKTGDVWTDRLHRLTKVSDISKEKFAEVASFFLNLS